MNNWKEAILVSSLFHDIGKVIHRADGKHSSHLKHQELGADWAKKFIDIPEASELIRLHHSTDNPETSIYYEEKINGRRMPKSIPAYIIFLADNYASGERDKKNKDFTFDITTPLKNIFDEIVANTDNMKKKNTYLSPYIFEKNDFLLKIMTEEEKQQTESKTYAEILNKIENDMKKISGISAYPLYLILEKYISYIPSFTYTKDEIVPDISLFDHSKMTAAIALCLYNSLTNHFKISDFSNIKAEEYAKIVDYLANEENENYLLIKGDFSGIQNFIYNIASTKALKHLRARSFYLQFLNRYIADKMVELLELFDANIIYCGGGNFMMLSQNTEDAISKIKELERDINSFLFDSFGMELFFTLSYVGLSANNMMLDSQKKDEKQKKSVSIKSLSDKYQILMDLSIKKKQRKHEERLLEIFESKDETNYNVCGFCEREKKVKLYTDKYLKKDEAVSEQKNICEECFNFIEFGSLLKDGDRISILNNVNEGLPLPFSNFAVPQSNKSAKIYNSYVINSFDIDDFANNKSKQFLIGNYTFADYASIEDLTRDAEGSERYAGIRMDVDNLGVIFKNGFKERNTLTRISVLSRYMSLFFNYFINYIDKNKVNKAIVVYSGGDDLFCLSSYDSALSFSKLIHDSFSLYTGLNPSVTISGGFVFGDNHHPVYMMSKEAEDLESVSKVSGKDRITMVEKHKNSEIQEKLSTFLWSDLKRIEDNIKLIEDNENILNSSFLQKMIKYVYMYTNGDVLILPKILYDIKKYEVMNKIKNDNSNWVAFKGALIMNLTRINEMYFPIYINILKNRK